MKSVSSIKNNKGFTLIELLAVISVLSIIITIVISISTNVIRKSKEDSYKVTINNIQKEAANYVTEGVTNTRWKETGIDNLQYQCVTVKNLIDTGYFKGDVLESYLNDTRKVSSNDQIYIERKDSDKAITKNVLLLDERYNGLCRSFDTVGDIYFSSNPSSDEWAISKQISINYFLHNIYDTNVSNYQYTYDFDNDSSGEVKNRFSREEHTASITVSENGMIYASIKSADNSVLRTNTFIIETIDKEAPELSISSTNNVANKQTVTFTLTDCAMDEYCSGISKFYYGNKSPEDSDWISMTPVNTKTITYELIESGTLYLGAIDGVGNKTIISQKFYKTNLNVTNAIVTPKYVITMNGNEFTVPKPTAYEYYTFNNWYENSNFSGSVITTYKPTKDGNLYGKVTENVLTNGTVLITGDAVYGNTLTAKITSDTTPKADKYTYQWYTNTSNSTSGGTKISGATSNTLVLKEGQFDKYIYVVITASKKNYKTITFADITDTTNNKNAKVGKKSVVVTANSSSKVYDGAALKNNGCEASGLVFGHTVSCAMTDDSTITNVGSVDNKIKTTLISSSDNSSKNEYYNISYVNGKLTITSKKVVIPTASNYCNLNLIYNGSEQTLTKNAGTGYTFSNNKATNAGSYMVTAKLGKNYMWDDNTSVNKTFSCSIGKKDSSIRLVPDNISVYTKESNYFGYTYEGDGSLTCSSSDEKIATCFVDTSNKKVNVSGKSAGTVNITLNASSGNNYNSSFVKGTAKVEDRIYDVNIYYNVNGGTLKNGTGNASYKFTKDTSGLVYKGDSLLVTSVSYTGKLGSDGLNNWDNSSYLNIERIGYNVPTGAEWKCFSNNCKKTTYSDTEVYNASDFCDASNSNCVVTLGVNWQPNTYTIKYNANGGTGSMTSHSCTYGENCTIKNNTFTKNGYKFIGFTTKSDGSDDGHGWTDWSGTWKYVYGQYGIANDNTLTLYARWEKIIYNVEIKYSVNGGDLTSQTRSEAGSVNSWTKDSNGIIYKNGTLLVNTVPSNSKMSSDGLVNYNNEKYIYITKRGHSAVSGAEWKCISGDCTIGKTYSQITAYNASDFCDATNGNCIVTLGVNWQPNTYTINYNANGGTGSMASQGCTYGENCTIKSNTFTRDGYDFLGFTTNSDGSDDGYNWTNYKGTWNFVNGEKGVSNNTLTLYAKWEKPEVIIYDVNIYYNVNGGTLKNGTGNASYKFTKDTSGLVYKGDSLLVTSVSYTGKLGNDGLNNWDNSSYLNIERIGYNVPTGAEWKCFSNNCKKTTYSDTEVYNASDFCDASNSNCVVTLGVNWQPNTYTIKYNANGGTGSMTSHSCTYGENCTIKNNTFTKNGYKFIGFTTKSDGSDDGYNWTDWSGTWKYVYDQYGIASDNTLTLYARWEKIIYNVEIMYSVNGGNLTSQTTSDDGNINSWTKDGKNLVYKNGSLLTTTIAANASLTGSGLVNPQWSRYLNINNAGFSVVSGEEWICVSSNCSGKLYNQDTLYKASEFCDASNGNCSVTLGVNWKPNTYTIKYNANGGTGSMASHSCTYNGNCIIKNNSFTRDGYTFAGFTTNSSGIDDGYGWTGWSGIWKFVYGQYGIASDNTLTLYAVWKKTNKTIINYNVNGGEFYNPSIIETLDISLNSNGLILKNGLALSTKIDYGNSTDKYGLIDWDNASYVFVVKKGYHVNDGTEWKCAIGDCLNKTYSDSKVYSSDDFCDSKTSDCTVELNVNWQPNTYTIKYNANGGTGSMTSHSCTYGESCTIKNNTFTKNGYKFIGFTTKSDGSDDGYNWTNWSGTWNFDNGQYGIASDNTLTLYARWEKIIYNVTIKYSVNSANGVVNTPTLSESGTVNEWYKDIAGLIYKNDSLLTTKIAASASLTDNGLVNPQWSQYLYVSTLGYVPYPSEEWICTSSNCLGKTFDQDTLYKASDFCDASNSDCEVTLGVNWKLKQYTINYNANGRTGSMASHSCTYNSMCTIKSNTFTRSGYTFVGFTTNSDGSDDGYNWTNFSGTWNFDNGQRGIVNDSLTLYAMWKENYNTVIKYNVNGGTIKFVVSGDDDPTWSSDVLGLIYKNDNLFKSSIVSDDTITGVGFSDWDDIVAKNGYTVDAGLEWKCLSGNCKKTTYSDAAVYNASDFCDSSQSTCEVVLGINWVDKVGPTITFSQDGSAGKWIKSIKNIIKVEDSGSGVNESTLKYAISVSSSVDVDEAVAEFSVSSPDETGVFKADTYKNGSTITLNNKDGKYYVVAKACDNVGNCTKKVSKVYKLDNTPPVITCDSSKATWTQKMKKSCQAFNGVNGCILDLFAINGGATTCQLPWYDGINESSRGVCEATTYAAYCTGEATISDCETVFDAIDENGKVTEVDCKITHYNDKGETNSSDLFKATAGNCLDGFCRRVQKYTVKDEAGNEAFKEFTYYHKYDNGHYDHRYTIECIKECNALIPRTGNCDFVYESSNCKVFGKKY